MQVQEMNTQAAWLWRIEQPALATESSATNSSVVSIAAVDSFEAAPQRTVFDDALGVESSSDGVLRAATVQERFSAVMTRMADNETLFHDVFEKASVNYDPTSVEAIRRKTVDGSVLWQLQPVLVEGDVRGDLRSGFESDRVGRPESVGATGAGAEVAAEPASVTDTVDAVFDRVREFLREFSVRSVLDGLA